MLVVAAATGKVALIVLACIVAAILLVLTGVILALVPGLPPVVLAPELGWNTGPNNLKLVSASGSAVKTAPSRPKAPTSNGSATMVSSGSI